MVREYYIRIRNTPDNKGGECAVVVWHWCVGNLGAGREMRRDRGGETVIYRVLLEPRWNLTSRYITCRTVSYNRDAKMATRPRDASHSQCVLGLFRCV